MGYVPSYISPSSAERFFACPGSVKQQQKNTEKEESNMAGMEGTAIHELGAWCLINGKSPKDYPHKKISVKNGVGGKVDFDVNEDFIYTAAVYVNTIYRELNIETDGDSRPLDGPQKNFQVEVKFKLPYIHAKARGTTDLVVLHNGTLYVFDLKTGRRGLVKAEENKQLLYYALDPFFANQMFIDKVVLYIIQPRGSDGDYFKKWETTPERLIKFKTELKIAIAKTDSVNAELVPGDHCKYCHGALSCPALQDGIADGVGEIMPQLKNCFPMVKTLTPKSIGDALYALEMLDTFRSALQKHAFLLAKNGADIPNYVLTKTNKHRKWRDEESVIQNFGEEYGDMLFEPKKILTPAKFEKLVGKEKVAEYIYKPEGEMTLKLKKDAVDEIKMSVEEAFKDVQIENM